MTAHDEERADTQHVDSSVFEARSLLMAAYAGGGVYVNPTLLIFAPAPAVAVESVGGAKKRAASSGRAGDGAPAKKRPSGKPSDGGGSREPSSGGGSGGSGGRSKEKGKDADARKSRSRSRKSDGSSGVNGDGDGGARRSKAKAEDPKKKRRDFIAQLSALIAEELAPRRAEGAITSDDDLQHLLKYVVVLPSSRPPLSCLTAAVMLGGVAGSSPASCWRSRRVASPSSRPPSPRSAATSTRTLTSSPCLFGTARVPAQRRPARA
jgi:hypothetical protein